VIPGARTFCLSVKLLNIFHDILESVYFGSQLVRPSRSRPRDAELLGKSLNLNHQLDQFLTLLPNRLGRFITNSPSTSCDQTCTFNLHELALVTRSVLSLSRKLNIASLHKSASADYDQIPVCADNASAPTDLVQRRVLYSRAFRS
jgi:hypothetical protein